MSISSGIQRLSEYQRRHGLVASLERAALAIRRALFSSRSVLFYCDLAGQVEAPPGLPASLQVECKKSLSDLDSQDARDILGAWNATAAERNLRERFALGASLWLIKSGARLAGYGWTLQGRTVEPHYFPLGPGDFHLFDFMVLKQYRGRGLNPYLVSSILWTLAESGAGRAFIEAAEWNHPQLASLSKTPFERLGRAAKLSIFGSTFVRWTDWPITELSASKWSGAERTLKTNLQ